MHVAVLCCALARGRGRRLVCGVRCIYLYVVQSAVSASLCKSVCMCNYNNRPVFFPRPVSSAGARHVSPASKPPPGLPFRLPV